METRRIFGSLLSCAMLLLVLTACATTPPPNPYKIAREQFQERVKRIVLAPLGYYMNVDSSDRVRTALEPLIEAHLRNAGFTVIPAVESAPYFATALKTTGGVYSSQTGQMDANKLTLVREDCHRMFKYAFNTDAVLFPDLEVVPADVWRGEANWDGATEKITFTYKHGTVAALSLVVTITDHDGKELYVARGGLEVITHVSGEKLRRIPTKEWLRDAERNTTGVKLALNPLLRQKP